MRLQAKQRHQLCIVSSFCLFFPLRSPLYFLKMHCISSQLPCGCKNPFCIRCAGKPQLSAAVLAEGIDTALVGHCKAAVDALVMRAALGVAAATAQQHDARYEQHRRKAAGGKKECPSPLLPFDGRAAQLTPAEYFRLGHGSCLRQYSVILHCLTLLALIF